MTKHHQPPFLPPEPIRGAELGSWAHYSIVTRLPQIVERVINENNFPEEIVTKLEGLTKEIPYQHIRGITDESAPDFADWKAYIDPYCHQNWLEVPWFFAETYFYRRILDTIGYFQQGQFSQFDPYTLQKKQSLVTSQSEICQLASFTKQMINRLKAVKRDDEITSNLISVFNLVLWGNQSDLSLWPVSDDVPLSSARSLNETPSDNITFLSSKHQKSNILIDDSLKIATYLKKKQNPLRIVFVLDNAGFELICDLFLIHLLLELKIAKEVRLHFKRHPTFVSDATIQDFEQALLHLKMTQHADSYSIAQDLAKALKEERLILEHNFYWNSPLSGWEMPKALFQQLIKSDLIITKGDANYRRWLGDRHWPYNTPFEQIMTYLPVPFLALRVLKAEIIAGLDDERLKAVKSADPEWMINGRWGIIQFSYPNYHS